MKTIKRLKQIAFSLGGIGFAVALFLYGLTFGLGIGWDIAYRNNHLSGIGPNRFQYMADTYLIILVCLLLFILFLKMRDKVFLKTIGLIPLAFILLQSRILILSKPSGLPNWVTEYSMGLEIILYMGHFFLILTIVLLVLQFSIIWLTHRQSIYVD